MEDRALWETLRVGLLERGWRVDPELGADVMSDPSRGIWLGPDCVSDGRALESLQRRFRTIERHLTEGFDYGGKGPAMLEQTRVARDLLRGCFDG